MLLCLMNSIEFSKEKLFLLCCMFLYAAHFDYFVLDSAELDYVA